MTAPTLNITQKIKNHYSGGAVVAQQTLHLELHALCVSSMEVTRDPDGSIQVTFAMPAGTRIRTLHEEDEL